MRTKANITSALSDAANDKAVWEGNPSLKMGDFGLNDFIAFCEAADAARRDYEGKDAELAGLREKRDDRARQLHDFISRFRSMVRGHFGSDSAEYGQVGGTRASQKKMPRRKPRADSAVKIDAMS